MPTITVTTNYYNVAVGETLTFTNESAFFYAQPAPQTAEPSVSIDGKVIVNQTAAEDIQAVRIGGSGFYSKTFFISPTGSLTVTSTAPNHEAIGFYGDSWGPNVSIRGSLTVTAVGNAIGVSSGDYGPFSYFQDGKLTVTSSAGYALGAEFTGSFVGDGDIVVTGKLRSIGVSINGDVFGNQGLIKVVDGTAQLDSIAVSIGGYVSASQDFRNWGRIEGDYALVMNHTYLSGNPLVRNYGVMVGKVVLGNLNETLVNSGTMTGDIELGLGNDVYDGRLGQYRGMLSGGDGADSIAGGALGEVFNGDAGADTIDGGGGDDVIAGGRDGDLLTGGAGLDTLDYATATMGVTLDFVAGRASSSGEDTISGFEAVAGSIYADAMTGGAGADRFAGDAGDDSLLGGGGGDTIEGGAGVDFLRGEEGDDSISGGAAFDDTHGNMGNDTVRGGDGDDWVVGGKDNDQLFGDAGADIVLGNLGDDTCNGGDGADTLRGGQANDVLVGGAGNDWLSGDLGADSVTGGAGADVFHSFAQAGVDVILDFNAAEGDRVMLDSGTVFAVDQVGANVVVNMGGGNYVVLLNTDLASLPEGWLFLG